MKRNHWFKRTAGLALALAVLLVSSMCSCALAEGKTFTFKVVKTILDECGVL